VERDETYNPDSEEPEELLFNNMALKNAVRRNMSLWRSHGMTGDRRRYSTSDDDDDDDDESETQVEPAADNSDDDEWCCNNTAPPATGNTTSLTFTLMCFHNLTVCWLVSDIP